MAVNPKIFALVMNHDSVVACWPPLKVHLSQRKTINYDQSIREQLIKDLKKLDTETMSGFVIKIQTFQI